VEPKKPKPDDSQPSGRPPGDFMDDKLADDTARFIAEAKRRAERRTRADAEREGWDRR
jgi:hypothetical protein